MGRCDDHWLRAHLDAADAAAYQAAWLDEHSLTSAQTSAALSFSHGRAIGAICRKPNDKARPWRVVARAMSERDVTQREQWCLRGADEVWVPTAWHLERFASAGVPRHTLRVIRSRSTQSSSLPSPPIAVRPPPERAYSGRLKKLTRTFDGNAAPFVFVSVFKWEWRKGWDLLLDAYWSEFGGSGGNDEKVLLKLKTYLPSWEPGPRDLNEHIERHAAEIPQIAHQTAYHRAIACGHYEGGHARSVRSFGCLLYCRREERVGAYRLRRRCQWDCRYRNQLIRSYRLPNTGE